MSIINTTTQVPAHIAARIAARKAAGTTSSVADAIGTAADAVPRISIRAGRYRLVEGGVETTVGITLDTIIVGANPQVSKVFYTTAYDAGGENARPTCWSSNGVAPDSRVEAPVSASCAGCPKNVLGSRILPSGAKSKLCADQRHIAVVPAADPSKVYSLTVPVSAMKALREYFKDLTNYGIAPEETITELGFDDAASYPKIVFKSKGFVPERAMSRVDELIGSDEVKVATRQLVAPAGGARLAAPAAPAAIAAPAVDEAYEHEVQTAPAPAAPASRPEVAPVKASTELAAKLDSLFDE